MRTWNGNEKARGQQESLPGHPKPNALHGEVVL
jgi:hypothetical protein